MNIKPGVIYQPEVLADYEMKATCEAWKFEHHVVVRNPGRHQLPYGGMPLKVRRRQEPAGVRSRKAATERLKADRMRMAL